MWVTPFLLTYHALVLTCSVSFRGFHLWNDSAFESEMMSLLGKTMLKVLGSWWLMMLCRLVVPLCVKTRRSRKNSKVEVRWRLVVVEDTEDWSEDTVVHVYGTEWSELRGCVYSSLLYSLFPRPCLGFLCEIAQKVQMGVIDITLWCLLRHNLGVTGVWKTKRCSSSISRCTELSDRSLFRLDFSWKILLEVEFVVAAGEFPATLFPSVLKHVPQTSPFPTPVSLLDVYGECAWKSLTAEVPWIRKRWFQYRR